MIKKERACPACSSKNKRLIFENNLSQMSDLDLSSTISGCIDCGFCYADGIPSQAIFDEYYRNMSKYDSVTTSVGHVDKLRVAKSLQIIRQCADKTSRILDIGFGNCALLENLRNDGFQHLTGVDQAANCLERAHLSGIENAHIGTIDNLDIGLVHNADLVLLMAVAEHLVDPKASISRIVSGMSLGSRVLIEVPCLAQFDGKKGEPYGEFSIEHLQFFSHEALSNLLADLPLVERLYEQITLPHALGSMFALYERTESSQSGNLLQTNDHQKLIDYVQDSENTLEIALDKLDIRELIVYGAGAHSARLIPKLESRGDRYSLRRRWKY